MPSLSVPLDAPPGNPGAPTHRARVHARTRELARLAGRVPPHVTQGDYEQARRELPDPPVGAPAAHDEHD